MTATSVRLRRRASWKPKRDNGPKVTLPALYAYLHHTVGLADNADQDPADEYAEMLRLEATAWRRFRTTNSYSFVPMRSGVIYEGHGIGTRGSHTKGLNSKAIGIALPGNYNVLEPTPAQIEQVGLLLANCYWLKILVEPRLTGGHRDVAKTACPGDNAYAKIPAMNAAAARAITIGPGPRRTPAQVIRGTKRVDLPHVVLRYDPRHPSLMPTGPHVVAVQKAVGAKPDGDYGPATARAVAAMQRRLGIVADGVYGPATEGALERYLSTK